MMMFFLCLVDFNDGVELLSMSLIMPIIKKYSFLKIIFFIKFKLVIENFFIMQSKFNFI
jgi:hypothetical protein